jgi:hypothetical protein
MNEKPYRIHVIVDASSGERIRDLPIEEPRWVVESADNLPIVQALWRERKTTNHLEGITSFKVDSKATPEDWLVSELSSIELHHGEFSHNPPWSVLNVIGVRWSERISSELGQFGFTEHVDTAIGFEAKRKQ